MNRPTRNYMAKSRPGRPTFEEAALSGIDSAIAHCRNDKAPSGLLSFMNRIGVPPHAILRDDRLDIDLLLKTFGARSQEDGVGIIWFALSFDAFRFSFLEEDRQDDNSLDEIRRLASRLGLRPADVDLIASKVQDSRGRPEAMRSSIRTTLQATIIELARFRDHLAAGLQRIDKILSSFHTVARHLARRHASRPPLVIHDEYDVQDLLYALLAVDFSNIRREEWTPSFAGSQSRMDFLLPDYRVVIEVKMIRAGLGQRELADQLLVDVGKYRTHPDCDFLIVLAYDPDSLLPNPTAIVDDFATKYSPSPFVITYVVPGP